MFPNDTSRVQSKKQVRKTHLSVSKSNNLLYDNFVYNGISDIQTNMRLTCYDKSSIVSKSFTKVKDLTSALEMDKVNWIHVTGLKDVEVIGELCDHFGMQVPVIQDILNVFHNAKVEETNNVLLVILDSYRYDEALNLNHEHMSIVLGDHVVISFEEIVSNRFDLVHKALEFDLGLVRSQKSDYLYNLLISMIVDSYLEVLELQQNGLMDLEDLLIEFNMSPKETGQKIQHFRKDYSILKKSISPLREYFGHPILMESKLIGKSNLVYFRDTNDHLLQVSLMMEANRETIASLLDLYLANNDLHMNQIMKQLTVVSTIFIPLTFMVGVWGMNFKFMPELGWHYGYLFAWVIMLVLSLFFYFWLRRKNMF